MKFGPVAPVEALGGTAVHTIRQGVLVLKKGTLIGPTEVAALEAAGISKITVARVEPDDVSEDQAAAEIAKAVAGEGVRTDRAFTGRANLFAESAGVLVVEREAIDQLNRVDEAITFATLPAFKPVVVGEMIATVKIIPFAVSKDAERQALATVRSRWYALPPTRSRKSAWSRRCCPSSQSKWWKTLKVTLERLHLRCDHRRGRRVPREQPALAKALDEVLKAGAARHRVWCVGHR